MPLDADHLTGHKPSNDPPYVAQDVQETAEMLHALERQRKQQAKGSVSARKQTYMVAESSDNIEVESWRMQDSDYKRLNLPTYARGLFTTHTRRKEPEIVARGYDKFFNVGEVSATKWANIQANTRPPYDLTLKENGCIIFVSGLEDGTLLVCSKHATGLRGSNDSSVSHSGAGMRSLEKQLERIGRTKADLARELRARNATAVAELCDDSFEEHILEYGPDKAGLYLHGVNLNLPRFVTWPSDNVQQFARDWGFLEIGVVTMQNIDDVKAFLEEAATTGAWGGRDVEGFVIRCQRSSGQDRNQFHDWFFKYKFEEPYLMYRQWRECTKAIIAGKSPRMRKHAKITEEYLLYVRRRLQADPSLGKRYNQNHGIIALRDGFLAFKGFKGSEAAAIEEVHSPDSRPEVTGDVLLVPISTIGCGKTTLALALNRLFPDWGHVQNDNIEGKGRPMRFTRECCDLLKTGAPVVVADRNNAQRHERRQIIKDAKMQNVNLLLVALAFDHGNIEEVRQKTRERVLSRGDNHQTIQAQSDPDKFIGVMEGFIRRFEMCAPESQPDDGFDHVITLDPVADSRANLETVVTELNKRYPSLVKEVPTADQLDAAIEHALAYQPDMKHVIPERAWRKGPGGGAGHGGPSSSQTPKKPAAKLEYLMVDVPRETVTHALEKAFAARDAATARFYKQLKQTRRVQSRFHVTLMHRATAAERPELWARYTRLVEGEGGSGSRPAGPPADVHGSVDVQLERVVFDDRIMTIVTRLVPRADGGGPWECNNPIAHVTVGTRSNGVKPKESNELLARWVERGVGDGIDEVMFEDGPVVEGKVRAVMSR